MLKKLKLREFCMKKILLLTLFMSIPVIGYTKEVVPAGDYIYIIDGKEVYFCTQFRCALVSSDYTKSK